jgi:branched-chain amino acid transport system substrate-binding protein
MKKWATAFAAGLALCCGGFARAQDVVIPVVLPMTGNAAFVGQEQKQMLELLLKSTNEAGGIQGHKLRFVYYDDQTTPQVAVQLAQQILVSHPNVILGSSITAMCNAMAPLMKNGPVMYCMSPGIHPAAGSYVFSVFVQTQQLLQAEVRYFRGEGWTKIALMTSADATGQDADNGMAAVLALPENADMKLVAHPHFNATDVSVAAQIEQIHASGAQTMIAWTTGSQVANIFKAIVQSGLTIPVSTSTGNMQFQQLAQYTGFLPKGLMIPTSLYPPHDGLITLDPRVEKVQHEMYAQLDAAQVKPDNATGTSWDAGLLVIAALRKFGPDATPDQVRDFIAGQTDFPGINGLYNFVAVPQRGLGVDDAIVVRYDPKTPSWVWLSGPGGSPLNH